MNGLEFSNELKNIRQELMVCLRDTLPSKEFRTTIMMAMVWLHVIEVRIGKTLDIIERRRLIAEFDTKRDAIQKGIEVLWQSSRGNCPENYFGNIGRT